jgi:hypothetical protein
MPNVLKALALTKLEIRCSIRLSYVPVIVLISHFNLHTFDLAKTSRVCPRPYSDL